MTNTRSRSGRSRATRRERRATVANALKRVAAQPDNALNPNIAAQSSNAAKVYDTAQSASAAKVYDAAESASAAKVYDTAQPRRMAKVYTAPVAATAHAPARPAAQPRSAVKRPVAQPRNAARANTAPATSTRRSYIGEPAPVDHSGEFRAIRRDLWRILVWASVLIIAMIALALLPIL